MSLRLIPDLTVIRPADGNETTAAWRHALEASGPTVLVLSRQDLPTLDTGSTKAGLDHGAYVLSEPDGEPDIVLLATGSEVQLAVAAASTLAGDGISARVVSFPSWEIFEEQDAAYKRSVLGSEETPRLSIEAGTTIGWERYADASVGVDRFGASGPGAKVMEQYGFTAENVVLQAKALLGEST